MSSRSLPPGMHAVTPHLVCAGALDAIEFYKKAFDAKEMTKLLTPEGRLLHGAITIGGSTVMLAEEVPQWGSVSPRTLKGTPVTIHLYVPDADATFAQAVTAGARVIMPVEEMFWGDRYGVVEDPFGHRWSVATPVRSLSPEEIAAAAAKMGAGDGCGSES